MNPVRLLLETWRDWARPGHNGPEPGTANRYPRPVHEYPIAQNEVFRLRTVPSLNIPGPARLPNTVPPSDVFDGVDLGGIKFRARTMFLVATDGRDPLSFDFETGRPEVPTANNPSGTIVVDVRGMQPGGVYWRRFDLTPYKAIEIDVRTWRRIRVLPLFSTLSGFDLVAILTEEPPCTQRDRVYFAQLLGKPNPSPTDQVFDVPPGAVSLVSTIAQPDAAWQSYTQGGLRAVAPIDGGAGLAVGTREIVQGAQLQLGSTDPGGLVIWEIEL